MQFKVILPYKVFVEKQNVQKITVKTSNGFFGLLPHRLDCVVVLTPGIFSWQCDAKNEEVIAVDAGILVKIGAVVLVSVRNAIGGENLQKLRQTITEEFMQENEQEKQMRLSLAKLESGFIQRYSELQNG